MRSFSNVNPKDLKEATDVLRQKGQSATIVGGGSDVLGMVKERLITPDVLVSLKSIRGSDQVKELKLSSAG
jgi:CO/xanthine dehydrogenase FAD-binding subunit